MYKWIEEHKKSCNKNNCEKCYVISESLWAMSQAQEEIKEKNNKAEPKPKVETKLEWDYRLREWREVIK